MKTELYHVTCKVADDPEEGEDEIFTRDELMKVHPWIAQIVPGDTENTRAFKAHITIDLNDWNIEILQ